MYFQYSVYIWTRTLRLIFGSTKRKKKQTRNMRISLHLVVTAQSKSHIKKQAVSIFMKGILFVI